MTRQPLFDPTVDPAKQESDQSTMDQPVQSVEPSASKQAPAMSVPIAEKRLDVPKNAFKRQLVLFHIVNEQQAQCEVAHGHFLIQPSKDIIVCNNCGALWLR